MLKRAGNHQEITGHSVNIFLKISSRTRAGDIIMKISMTRTKSRS